MSGPAGPAPGLVARLLLTLIRGYQRWISPLLGPRCRFAPTCSAYAAEALRRHGAARGSLLAVRRLARCHPFHPGGHDPVPPNRAGSATMESAVAPSTSEAALLNVTSVSPVGAQPPAPAAPRTRRPGATPC